MFSTCYDNILSHLLSARFLGLISPDDPFPLSPESCYNRTAGGITEVLPRPIRTAEVLIVCSRAWLSPFYPFLSLTTSPSSTNPSTPGHRYSNSLPLLPITISTLPHHLLPFTNPSTPGHSSSPSPLPPLPFTISTPSSPHHRSPTYPSPRNSSS